MRASLFLEPKNVGDVDQPSYVGRSASFDCGASIRISLQIDENHRITEAKFRAAGCSVLVASASLLTSEARLMTTGEAASLVQLTGFLNDQIGTIDPARQHCAEMAGEALINAISEYSDSIRDEWTGDEALICTCFSVSEKVIEQQIRIRSLVTIEDVTRACNAGAGCRSCYPLIQELLDYARRP